ncbi:Acg family FMN-binding oxidoreductase [Actinomycetospora cinnamomea]|uniref:Nitroreductase n=1 Tax=Actinomycetospora cinnamomea TaxID=663609 RepID=A0A2U1F8A9_9PSEU|nr:hypothetical protein [Actinomycetospora cinnamomea]PVZ08433.1 nitroreductase [Actinomycetospora cinnamomea]
MPARTRVATVRELLVGGALIGATLVGAPLLRSRYNRWGATDDEVARPLPGDELVERPKLGYTRAVTIDAPPEEVWSWLVQFGQDRGGFYSYDALENLVGCDIHSTDRVLQTHQHLVPGEVIRSGGRDRFPCWVVMEVDPPHSLVLQGAGTPADVVVPEIVHGEPPGGYVASTWQWHLEPVDGGGRTRLLVRQRCTYGHGQAVLWHLVEPLNFVMERRMLLGLRERAEAGRRPVQGTGRHELVRVATTAPSSHNTQPWRFVIGDDQVLVGADRTRRLPVNDPDDRELIISCGAAAFTFEVAARHAGLVPIVERLPDGEKPDLLYRLSLSGGAVSDTGSDIETLYRAVHARRTTRGGFTDDQPAPELLEKLAGIVAGHGAWLELVDERRRAPVAALIAEGDRTQFADPRWRHELASWLCARRADDGLAVPSLVVPVARGVVRHLDLGRSAARRDHHLAVAAPVLAVLGTTEDRVRDRLVAGEALQHVLLASAAHGVHAGYLNQPCQVPELRPRLREVLDRPGHPQVVLRLGRPTNPPAPAPRRPVEAVVDLVGT